MCGVLIFMLWANTKRTATLNIKPTLQMFEFLNTYLFIHISHYYETIINSSCIHSILVFRDFVTYFIMVIIRDDRFS